MQEVLDTISYLGGFIFGIIVIMLFLFCVTLALTGIHLDKSDKKLAQQIENERKAYYDNE